MVHTGDCEFVVNDKVLTRIEKPLSGGGRGSVRVMGETRLGVVLSVDQDARIAVVRMRPGENLTIRFEQMNVLQRG